MKSIWDNLLVRFSVVSLVVLAAVAVSIAVFVSDRIRTDAIDEVIDRAASDTYMTALRELEPADFERPMTGERFNEFDRWVRSTLLTGVTAMVKVWSANGTLVYSSDPGDAEEDPLHEPHLPSALSGLVAAHIHPAEASRSGSPRGNDLFEVYAPVVLPGTTEVLGAIEIYEYYAPTAQRILEMRTWVFLITGLGFIALYGTLVTIVWGASKTIGRQRSALVETNLELESRVEARTGENSRLYQELRAGAEQQAVIDEVARIVTSTLDIDQVYEKFAAEVKKLVDFERIAISMIDHDAGTFSGKYISGVSTEGRRVGVVVPLEGSGAERILRTGRPFLRQDIRIDESLSGDSARLQVGLRSSLGVPLFTKSRITGILTVHSHRVEAFGPRDQAILERLADQVAPAVESAQLYESLRQSETTNRAFVRAIPDNMFRLRRDGMYLDCIAPKPEDLYDPSGDYVGRTIYEILPAELAQMIMASIERALQTGEIQKYEYQSTRRAKVQERELRIVADGPDDVLIISRDITERKRMEDALRDSEERFRRLFEESPVGVTLVDEEFRVIGANNAFCRMLGYTEEDLVGGTIADVTHLEEVVASEELLKKTLSGETPGFQLETRLITKERGIIWARVTGGPVHDDAGKPQYVIGVIENVSERKLLQEQLGQAQKMEVVGQLAGGVAHDFNNLLTPILGFSDLGMEELTPDHPARRYFEQVQSAAERGADLVRRLMLFVRQACHASRR